MLIVLVGLPNLWTVPDRLNFRKRRSPTAGCRSTKKLAVSDVQPVNMEKRALCRSKCLDVLRKLTYLFGQQPQFQETLRSFVGSCVTA